MLKTNSKKYRDNVRAYILAAIPEEWGSTDREKLQELRSEFERVSNYPYNLQKFPNIQAALAITSQACPLILIIQTLIFYSVTSNYANIPRI